MRASSARAAPPVRAGPPTSGARHLSTAARSEHGSISPAGRNPVMGSGRALEVTQTSLRCSFVYRKSATRATGPFKPPQEHHGRETVPTWACPCRERQSSSVRSRNGEIAVSTSLCHIPGRRSKNRHGSADGCTHSRDFDLPRKPGLGLHFDSVRGLFYQQLEPAQGLRAGRLVATPGVGIVGISRSGYAVAFIQVGRPASAGSIGPTSSETESLAHGRQR